MNTTTTTGALPWRRSIKEPTTTVADNGTEARNVTAGTDYNTPAAGNLTTIEMVTVASTVTRNMTAETLETTAGITVDNTTEAGTTILNRKPFDLVLLSEWSVLLKRATMCLKIVYFRKCDNYRTYDK